MMQAPQRCPRLTWVFPGRKVDLKPAPAIRRGQYEKGFMMIENRKLRDGEGLVCWLLLAFSLFVLALAYQISGFSSISSAGTFPMGAAAVMVVSMLFLLFDNRKCTKPDSESRFEEWGAAIREIFPLVILVYLAIVIIYVALIEPLHFLPVSFGFLLLSMIYLKGSSALKSLIISALTLGGIYIVFLYVFKVVLP